MTMQPLGFTFTLPNKWGMYLSEIINPILSTPSIWVRGEFEEILCLDVEGEVQGLFDNQPQILDNLTLKKVLFSKKHYTIVSNLFGYVNKMDNYPFIKSLQDFIDSEAGIAIAIYDSTDVIVLAKDSSILKTLEESCRNLPFEDLEYVYADSNITFD